MSPTVVFLAFAFAQPDPAALLDRARAKIAANVSSIARYTCTQTIDRELRRTPEKAGTPTCKQIAESRGSPYRLWSRDRIRTDLIVADDKEQQQWTGGGIITPAQLQALLFGGALGSGDFSGFPNDILARRSAGITFDRTLETHGRTVVEYRYSVPVLASLYRIGSPEQRVTIPYSGTFQLDASTADLVQLLIHGDQVPELTDYCSVETLVEFNRLNVRGNSMLIPQRTHLDAAMGFFHVLNTTTYSQCREFAAESTIRFDPAESAAAQTTPLKQPYPRDTLVTLKLETPIDSRTSAAGDAIRARPDDRTGAVFHGRIIRLTREYAAPKGIVLTLIFTEVELAGHRQPIDMRLATRRLFFAGRNSIDLRPGWQTKWLVR